MGGGGSSNEGQSAQSSAPWGPQQPHFINQMDEGERLYNEQRDTQLPDTPMYAPMSQQTQQGMDQRGDYINNGMQDYVNNVMGGQDTWMNAPDVANNPYVNAMIDAGQQRTFDNFSENVMPQIQTNALQDNMYGNSRQGVAEGVAAAKAAQVAADYAAQVQGSAYQTGMDAYMTGLGMAPQTAQLGLMPGQAMTDLGTEQEYRDFQPSQEEWTRWYFNQTNPWDVLSNYQGITQGNYGSEGAVEQGSTTPPELTGDTPPQGTTQQTPNRQSSVWDMMYG